MRSIAYKVAARNSNLKSSQKETKLKLNSYKNDLMAFLNGILIDCSVIIGKFLPKIMVVFEQELGILPGQVFHVFFIQKTSGQESN